LNGLIAGICCNFFSKLVEGAYVHSIARREPRRLPACFIFYLAETRRASVATVTSGRSAVAASSVRGSLSRTNTLPSRPASAPKTPAKDTPKSNKSEYEHGAEYCEICTEQCNGWLVEQGLTSRSTQFRSFRRRCVYRSDDPTNSVKALKEGG